MYIRVYDKTLSNPTASSKRISASLALPWGAGAAKTAAQCSALGFKKGDILFKSTVTDEDRAQLGWVLVQVGTTDAYYWRIIYNGTASG
jgi:hypothetical protein